MPELPEVETVRRGLQPAMEGARIGDVELRRPDLRFPLPEGMKAALESHCVALITQKLDQHCGRRRSRCSRLLMRQTLSILRYILRLWGRMKVSRRSMRGTEQDTCANTTSQTHTPRRR